MRCRTLIPEEIRQRGLTLVYRNLTFIPAVPFFHER